MASSVHLWLGLAASLYIVLMSVTGSIIVFRVHLWHLAHHHPFVYAATEWLVALHSDLLLGPFGRMLNALGALVLTLLCLTGAILWWPGIDRWRRNLSVDWKANFARLNLDLHNALGFWFLGFASLWGISGIYLSYPELFAWLPSFFGRSSHGQISFGEATLYWLAFLHFGRFTWLTKVIWALAGLVPAVLGFTGVVIGWRHLPRRAEFAFACKAKPLPDASHRAINF